MRKIGLILSLSMLILCSCLYAQTTSGLLQKKLVPVNDTLLVDPAGIVPGSVLLFYKDELVPPADYRIEAAEGKIILLAPAADSFMVYYRTLPGLFTQKMFHKDPKLIEQRGMSVANPFSFSPSEMKEDLLGFGGLNRSGSISRGISVGNNRDLSVNSSLNLQLSGKVADDIEVLAAISDDNIPIQPEGNTQQIQDFDRVYIQLKKEENRLVAGDFELRRPNSYFMNFYKRAKGGYFTTEQKLNSSLKVKGGVAGAIAKGKYIRYVFDGKEGVQGPYRLRGENNETYIIVLSGSERIYLDGELLKRGENNDYVIDYNTAELSFTPKRIITQYRRITVEFEYSERNYARSLFYANTELESERWNLRFNFYNEQDSKNRPLLQSLNDNQKLFLASVGDDIANAYYPNIDSLGFDANEIRYKKIDSLGYQVYVYSTNPDSAVYRLGFTELGQGRGNYIQSNSMANGRVFQWVAPVAGIPQGNFEPIVLLVTPKKSQLLTYGADYKVNDRLKVTFEGAYSDQDVNLYATRGNADNKGFASRTGLEYTKGLRKDSLGETQLISGLTVEFVDKNFRALELFRAVEFNREYNLTNTNKANELLISAYSAIEKNNRKLVYYRFNTFLRDSLYTGIQNSAGTDLQWRKISLVSAASLLNTTYDLGNSESSYLKHKADLSREWKYTVLGFSEETEINMMKDNTGDSLSRLSFWFNDLRVYLQNPAAWVNKYRIDYSNRLDKTPYFNDFRSSTRAEMINASTEFNKNPRSILALGSSYRRLNVLSDRTTALSEESIVSRIRYDVQLLKGFITSSTLYEIGSGQEPKREFTYVQVPMGQGVYVHKDYNNNGIKELNEFEIARFSYEADYIRVYLTTNDFVRTNATVFSESLMIDPSKRYSNRKGILKTVSLFSNQAALKIDRKTLSSSGADKFNPFDVSIPDTALITLNTSIRNTFYFKRTDPVFGTDYTYQESASKSFLTGGFDQRGRKEHLLNMRWNVQVIYGINLQVKRGLKSYNSDLLADRDFDIDFTEISPELSYQYLSTVRLSLNYSYGSQLNRSGTEKVNRNSIGTECRYNASGKSTVSARLTYIKNEFNSNSNTAIAYEMLEGLQIGNNITWNLTWQRNLGPNFQLNVNYDGRRSEGASTIHAGSVQARAFF